MEADNRIMQNVQHVAINIKDIKIYVVFSILGISIQN